MTRVRIGCAADLTKGTLRRFEADGVAICVARTDDGVFHAVEDRCTHEDVELSDGDLVGDEIECPLHGSLFDVATGAVRGLPATEPLRVYPLSVDGDDLVVEL